MQAFQKMFENDPAEFCTLGDTSKNKSGRIIIYQNQSYLDRTKFVEDESKSVIMRIWSLLDQSFFARRLDGTMSHISFKEDCWLKN